MGFMDGLASGYGQGSQLGVSMYKDMQADDLRRSALAQADAEKKAALDRQLSNDAYAKGQDERNYQLKLKELGMKNKGGPNGLKLKPGERYDPSTDTVEIMPGTSLYNDQAGKHAKDLSATQAAKMKRDLAAAKVDEILNPEKPENLRSQFGGYNALASRWLHPDAMNAVNSLQENLKSTGLDLLKSGGTGGIGAISEAEWPILRDQITKLSPAMSEQQAAQELKRIKDTLDEWQTRINDKYNLQWGNTQFTRPMRTGPKGFHQSAAPGNNIAPPANQKRYQIIGVE